ncbi:transcriptional regulator, TetR family [Kribbella flavida DSM 17836]|uniref:Transcriptional regulator, TetR family n=1 Tax=Kribbella flavida (strain DSM 17836 / JCM 10339 / NBRC 14399) TaxID=479435 RepID=D2PP55_KRIFD|nr:TetR/AcrR family transcriptional regulator [Kribbella flavida]ADB34651.1 transcriptional regulator, TetR family [Kribbella flavida DSM 17836]
MQQETKSRDTKGDIHRAALELFSSQGYEKTSLREIAEQVGITKASLYYHYSSKQDLLKAIIGTFFDDLYAMFQRVDTVPWSPEAERELLAAYLDVVITHRATGPTVLRDIAAVLAAFGDDLGELIERSRRFQLWLAGPDPSPRDRVIATAAVEVVGAVFSAGLEPAQLSDAEFHQTLLEAATAVLTGRRNVPS